MAYGLYYQPLFKKEARLQAGLERPSEIKAKKRKEEIFLFLFEYTLKDTLIAKNSSV